jgi:hypothetical protein
MISPAQANEQQGYQPIDYPAILAQVAQSLNGEGPYPKPDTVVAALLAAEKFTKQTHQRFTYDQLLGTWRLGFVTGTSRSRKVAGRVIGAGRYLPKWLQAEISYQPASAKFLALQTASGAANPSTSPGQIGNSVTFGPFRLKLTGPNQLWSRQNLLSFDFTRLTLELGALPLYRGYSWRGQQHEQQFYQQAIKQQAFFNHFWVQPDAIAARGRGGGLALWYRRGEG